MGGNGLRVPGDGFGEQGGLAHFLEDVKPVVAGGAVSAQAHVDAGGEQRGHRRESAGKLEVRGGAVGHRTAVVGEQGDFLRGQVHRMH